MSQIFRRPVAQKYVQRLAAFFDLRDGVSPVAGDLEKLEERRFVSRVGLTIGAASAVVAAVAAQAPVATGWAKDILAAAGLLANYATPVGFAMFGAARLSAESMARKRGHACLASAPVHPDGVESLLALVTALRAAKDDRRRVAVIGQARTVIDQLASPDDLSVAELLIEVSRKMGGDYALGFARMLPEKVVHGVFVRATIKGIELRQGQEAESLQERDAEPVLHLSNF